MTPRSGRCNRCRRHYADLLDHIKKKHRQDKFTVDDVTDTALLVCRCGRVLLNKEGMIKHQLRYSCTASTPRQSPYPSFNRSSTLSSAPPTPRPTPTPLSSPLSTAPSSRSTSAGYDQGQLGFEVYAGDMDLDPVEEEGGDGDTESDTAFTESATTSTTSPPSTPPPILPPSQPSTPAGRLLLAQLTLQSPTSPTLPASPVLPITRPAASPGSSSSTTTTTTESTVSGQDVRDQPFMDKFRLLDELGNREVILDGAKRKPMDVDRWEMVISPAEYLRRFKDTLADVQLISRAPMRKLHTTHHRGPAFDRYMLLGEATHQLWVDVRHKEAVLEELNKFNVVQPGRFNYQATLGNTHVPTAVFIHCLDAAGCDTIRLKAYGQKMPMLEEFMQTEPADVDHRWAEHNEWDIGTSFDSPYIWLFASATGIRHGITHYPILVPGSRDYGTVNLKVKHGARHYSVKIYPRLIHVIKSFNSHLQGGIPKTLRGVQSQLAAGLRMIHSLTGKDPMGLGGFRIEVTVKARSLAEAAKLVRRTPFMDPRYWLGQGDGPHAKHRLSAKVVERGAFLENANWVYQQAQLGGIFLGGHDIKPTRQQIQALTDVFNALGWNNGLRTATKSLAADAWWNSSPTSAPTLFGSLSQHYQTDEEIKELFQLARANSGTDGLPCKRQPEDRHHRYQVNSQQPFRIRCCVHGCYHKLQRAAIIHWIAELVSTEVIDGTAALGT